MALSCVSAFELQIAAERKTVTGDDGSITSFNKLLIATGSTPLIPPMDGVKKEGVFVFRNLDDTRALLDRAAPGKKAVVIGGGLLGLEAARGLQVQGCDVTVVHLMDTLMERQLDLTGGSYLKAKMECLGVKVLLERNTTAISGMEKQKAWHSRTAAAWRRILWSSLLESVRMWSSGAKRGYKSTAASL